MFSKFKNIKDVIKVSIVKCFSVLMTRLQLHESHTRVFVIGHVGALAV